MKVSLNWVKQFTDIDISVDKLVEKIGSQLGAVEEVVNLGSRYQGIVIVRVVACEKHPDADKLSLCKVDDGGKVADIERDEAGHIQVVCGAPNVREGLLAAWLPPGATVPSSPADDPFVLSAREIRGKVSNGMLASAQELAITEDHNGIVEVDLDVAPGTDFAEAYELNDHIIDIENKMFTHRPDCFGMLGIAREIAGILDKPFTSPEWYVRPLGRLQTGHDKLPLEVRNEAGELVPRFMALTMSGIRVQPSPFTIQTYLARVGIRPINNIVDVTNYLMVLTGQPLHAYDYDKVLHASGGENAVLIARHAGIGEKLRLLNGKEVVVQEGTVLIATDTTPIGIAGVMGGADTEVDASTQNIILECANFDMYAIRRASMAHGLFTDAVTRFNKGQSPLQNDRVLEEAAVTVQYLTGALTAGDIHDVRHADIQTPRIDVTTGFINERLGLSLEAEGMATRLRNVEFVVDVHEDRLQVTPPFWRTDIHISEDIVEEVGRLGGYDHLPLTLPARSIMPPERNDMLDFRRQVRTLLASYGANEVLTYSFVHGNLLDKAGQDKQEAYALSNALSPDLQYYRLSLTPSLLSLVHPNIKAGHDGFGLFEMNKVHSKHYADEAEPELPKEIQMLAYVTACKKPKQGAAFYQARQVLDAVAGRLGMTLRYTPMDQGLGLAAVRPFDQQRSAVVYDEATGTRLGVIGEYTSSVRRALKLPSYCAGFEIGLEEMAVSAQAATYCPLSRFPKVVQDMTLAIAADRPYGSLRTALAEALAATTQDELRVHVEALDIYQKSDDKHVTFRFTVSHENKTLLTQEVNQLLDDVASRLDDSIQARRI